MTLARTIAIVAAVFTNAAAAAGEPPEIREGRVFPEISLPALDGGALHSLAERRGRKVLLLIFASW